MLQFSVPPGYRRTAPVRRPKLDEFTALIEQWLEDDHRHGYTGTCFASTSQTDIEHIVAASEAQDHVAPGKAW